MKRTLFYTCIMLAAVALLSCEGNGTGTTDETVTVTGVTVNPTSYTLKIGDEVTLQETVAPADATNKDVSWSSSNEAIATVENGVVTAIADGEAVIMVKTVDGGKEATCTITVSEDVVPVESVSLDETEIALAVGGEPFTLTPSVLPETATNKEVTWKSENSAVATVANGVVTAVAEGSTKIVVTTIDGEKTAECTVTVTVPVTGVSWRTNPVYAAVNEPFGLNQRVIIEPDNATNKSVVFSISDESTLTIDADGMATAHKFGEAKITVTTVDGGYEAELTVIIPDTSVHVESVELDRTNITLMFPDGNAKTIAVTVLPENADDKSVVWESSDNGVVTVVDGVLTPVAEGAATVTVKSVDGNKSAECAVAVTYLGEVTFLTDNTWKPSTGNGRTISDVVLVERCRKTTYAGGSGPGSADCRENQRDENGDIQYGDLMSFLFVTTYQAQLCPAPWFVPAGGNSGDFFALDRDLGGNGNNSQVTGQKYIDNLGVTFGGSVTASNVFSGQGNIAVYWTKTKYGSTQGYVLEVNNSNKVVYPQKYYAGPNGYQLRCVKL